MYGMRRRAEKAWTHGSVKILAILGLGSLVGGVIGWFSYDADPEI